MNVSERYREIASLKVLGFYDDKALTYVYRGFSRPESASFLWGVFSEYCSILPHCDDRGKCSMFGRVIETASYICAKTLDSLVMYFKPKNR